MGPVDPTAEHLALDTHPASLTLVAQIVRGRTVCGYEPEEWGARVSWKRIGAQLVTTERAACELARAVAIEADHRDRCRGDGKLWRGSGQVPAYSRCDAGARPLTQHHRALLR